MTGYCQYLYFILRLNVTVKPERKAGKIAAKGETLFLLLSAAAAGSVKMRPERGR
jgi:hypothetical protein